MPILGRRSGAARRADCFFFPGLRAEEVEDVLPERQGLQALGPHGVFCRDNFALGARMRNAGLLLANRGNGDKRVRPYDGYVAARRIRLSPAKSASV